MQISEEVDKISGKTLTLVFTCLYLCFHSYALRSSSIQVCEQHSFSWPGLLEDSLLHLWVGVFVSTLAH